MHHLHILLCDVIQCHVYIFLQLPQYHLFKGGIIVIQRISGKCDDSRIKQTNINQCVKRVGIEFGFHEMCQYAGTCVIFNVS